MVKKLPANAGSIPGLGIYPPEGDIATHSSILAWEMPWDRGAWRATVHGGGLKTPTRLGN